MQGTDQLRNQLEDAGIKNLRKLNWNLSAPDLYTHAIKRDEAKLADNGPLVAITAPHTGRSPNDKFTVREPSSEKQIWWGKVNVEISEENFERLHKKILDYLPGRDVYVFDGNAGTDERYRLPIRVVTENAWQNLFARNMFLPLKGQAEMENHKPEFTVLHAPNLQADPNTDGTVSGTFVVIHFGKKLVLNGGTSYAGEIKKSIFTIMNYLLPQKGIFSMHCSANIGVNEDVALFFGLSGTGKTTLSADPSRRLIGDDEHGWSDDGVFNFEGGCYAKVIRLSEEAEPDIYKTTSMFGTILENVILDPVTRVPDLDDAEITENTRASYPISFIENHEPSGKGGHPKNIFMLTADAFGVMPPISKLTPEQAMYYFLSGYTAKVAGTEKGVTEPKAVFSVCFGAPFMALHPSVYADLLGKKMQEHKANCWLLNTGWVGGPYGVGSRIQIKYTRAMIKAALEGSLAQVETIQDPFFGLHIPTSCEGVSPEVLNPKTTWADKNAYDVKAKDLANRFHTNFEQFAGGVSEAIRQAAPNRF